MRKLRESDFKVENYEDFYENHYFQSFSDEQSLDAHEYLPRVSWALDIAREMNAKRILDLGCLEGNALLTVAHHMGASGVGVDLSQDGIEVGNRRAKQFELDVVFYQDALERYLEDAAKKGEKFDLVFLFEVMEHVLDPKTVIKLVDKVLAPGGNVLISTPAFESPTYGKNDVKNKCHIRLYTMKDEDYEEMTNHNVPTEPQRLRKATSITKQVGKKRIISMDVYTELIHCRYK